MTMNSDRPSPRYVLHELLGSGGMGTVYRAFDRLSRQDVALKRVRIAGEPEASGGLSLGGTSRLVALAHEFRTLASLRHPHIIPVLDYGFDQEQRPFYIMELLDGGESIGEVAARLTQAGRVALLAQICEALAYLHRRGVVHHDLKPANLLVADGRVRLLDFGLATLGQPAGATLSGGTLAYLAPEVLDGQPYSVAADLYSLGVIAYELLIGRHPFPALELEAFLAQLFEQEPDLTALADQPALAELVARLLAKTPAGRPESAAAILALLRRLQGPEGEQPGAALHESFLRAAPLVGREAELAELRGALAELLAGKGALWLIGGESGVGKSRLLEEFRAEALVAGTTVVIGQGVSGGGVPYQAWREPLRRLLLDVAVDDFAAGVLRALVPDIESLLERPVAAVPELAGEAGRQRLHEAVRGLLQRVARPTLLLLEDVHWMDESLELLAEVQREVGVAPLLIVGSYQNSEAPELPARLPAARLLILRRLGEGAVEELCRSFFGPAGGDPALVALLQRESEGNCFFLVEVARALAEEAGGLLRVGQGPLPKQIAAAGVQQVVLRRLGRVSEQARPLLACAALLGRQLDLVVLEGLCPAELTLGAWLQRCLDAGVLEVAEDRWRFAHDKLREVLLAELPAAERAVLHRRVAAAIEATYAEAQIRELYADGLMEHWRGAGEAERELHYALIVGATASLHQHYPQLQQVGERVLALTGQSPLPEHLNARVQAYTWLARARARLAHPEPALELVAAGLRLAEQLGDQRGIMWLLIEQSEVFLRLDRLDASEQAAAAALALASALADGPLRALALRLLAQVFSAQGDYSRAVEHNREALAIFEAHGDWGEAGATLLRLGNDALDVSDYPAAQVAYQRCMELSRAVGNRVLESRAMINLGLVHSYNLEFAEAEALFTQQLRFIAERGGALEQAVVLVNLADVTLCRGQPDQAERQLQQAHELYRSVDNQSGLVYVLMSLGQVACFRRDWPAARERFGAALELAERIGFAAVLGAIHTQLGDACMQQGDPEAARGHLESGLSIARGDDYQACVIEALAALALLEQQSGAAARGAALLGEALQAAAAYQHQPTTLMLLLKAARYLAVAAQGELAARCVLAVTTQPRKLALWQREADEVSATGVVARAMRLQAILARATPLEPVAVLSEVAEALKRTSGDAV